MEHSSPPVILIVDNDPKARQLLRNALSSGDYRLVETTTAAEAMEAMEASKPMLILTELDLPDASGIQMIRRMCSRKHKAPILVVSAQFTRKKSVVATLDAGADDFVRKPFSAGELGARVRVALRHAAVGMLRTRNVPEPFRAGTLEVDFYRRKVQVSGRDVHLTPVEFEILSLLVANINRALTYEELLVNAWKSKKDRQPQHVRVQIANLRKKLERDPTKPRHLVTEPGVGYQFHYNGW